MSVSYISLQSVHERNLTSSYLCFISEMHLWRLKRFQEGGGIPNHGTVKKLGILANFPYPLATLTRGLGNHVGLDQLPCPSGALPSPLPNALG